VKSTQKAFGLAIIAAVAVLGTGCGGFQGSHSISPASFFLPGLLQNKSQVEKVEPIAATPPVEQAETVAQSL
jgi:hypothetical protein